jgi:hypothetical protein
LAPTLKVQGTGKRRQKRRFFVAALLLAASQAFAQQSITAVQPVIDMMLADEGELAAALQTGDAAQLQRLAWSNRQAAFALVKSDPPIIPDDPAAKALRAAHVACADTHSNIGMLAYSAVQVALTNKGGENTRVDNDTHRSSFAFFFQFLAKQRQSCADRTGIALPPSPLAKEPRSLFAKFAPVITKRLAAEDRIALAKHFAELVEIEQSLPRAVAGTDPKPIRAAALKVMESRSYLNVREDPDMPRRDFVIIKECKWAVSHISQILADVHEGMIRPEIRASQFAQARETLDQYRGTKASCAAAMNLPREAGLVRDLTEADFYKP